MNNNFRIPAVVYNRKPSSRLLPILVHKTISKKQILLRLVALVGEIMVLLQRWEDTQITREEIARLGGLYPHAFRISYQTMVAVRAMFLCHIATVAAYLDKDIHPELKMNICIHTLFRAINIFSDIRGATSLMVQTALNMFPRSKTNMNQTPQQQLQTLLDKTVQANTANRFKIDELKLVIFKPTYRVKILRVRYRSINDANTMNDTVDEIQEVILNLEKKIKKSIDTNNKNDRRGRKRKRSV